MGGTGVFGGTGGTRGTSGTGGVQAVILNTLHESLNVVNIYITHGQCVYMRGLGRAPSSPLSSAPESSLQPW